MKPAFSVVIPLYNKEQYILRTLQSVTCQSVNDIEVVVIDDGSTDFGPDVVNGLGDPRIRLVRQDNAGVSAARNRGIVEACGEIISFLDADDAWMPTYLENVLAMAQEFQDAGIFASGYRRMYARAVINVSVRRRKRTGVSGFLLDDFFDLFAKYPIIHTSSISVRRHIFDEVGYFNESTSLGEDQEMWARIILRTKLAYCPECLAVYYYEDGSLASPGRCTDYRVPAIVQMILETLREQKDIDHLPPGLMRVAEKKMRDLASTALLNGDEVALGRIIKPLNCSTRRWQHRWYHLLFAIRPRMVARFMLRLFRSRIFLGLRKALLMRDIRISIGGRSNSHLPIESS